jgi:hypothetical protein
MKQFHIPAIMAAASLVATAMLLTSCGSSNTTVTTNRLVSPAQEEADLKRALDYGAITQSEYQEQIDKVRRGN